MREGWKRITLGDVFDVSTTKLGAHTEEPAVFAISKYDGVILSGDYHDRRVASAKLDGYKVLDVDAWAYSTIHIDEGSIARNNHGFAGVVSPMYTILKWVSEDWAPAYFEHLLRTPEMLSTYKGMAQGSINRRRSLPWKTFAAIEVEVPPLEEQQRIVDLIGSLDDAIDAADAAAETARASTGELRRDMLAPRDGVETVTLKDVARWGSGKYVAKENRVAAGRYPILGANGEIGRTDSFLYDEDLITVGRVGACGEVHRCSGKSWVSDNALVARPEAENFEYVYQAVQGVDYSALISGTSQPLITQTALLGVSIAWPPADERCRIAALLTDSAAAVAAAETYASTLRSTRSELLTVLLSGEHEIPQTYEAGAAA